VWVDDEDFDLDCHLVQATLPALDALPDYMGRVLSRELDRSRPLWEVHLVDGLADDGAALVTRGRSWATASLWFSSTCPPTWRTPSGG
jgi:diacylglycerol O-acyltransferase